MTSVMLALLMGQPRIFHAMAEDGLLPKFFAKIHPKYKTPFIPTLITGIFCAAAGGLLPIDVLGEMSSIGTLFAFVLTNVGVIVLRHTHPEVPRRFRIPGGVPGGFIVPGIGHFLFAGVLVP
jgi:APA family basic amino acid/polyamine antiporter